VIVAIPWAAVAGRSWATIELLRKFAGPPALSQNCLTSSYFVVEPDVTGTSQYEASHLFVRVIVTTSFDQYPFAEAVIWTSSGPRMFSIVVMPVGEVVLLGIRFWPLGGGSLTTLPTSAFVKSASPVLEKRSSSFRTIPSLIVREIVSLQVKPNMGTAFAGGVAGQSDEAVGQHCPAVAG
jgi:hypothetical protein